MWQAMSVTLVYIDGIGGIETDLLEPDHPIKLAASPEAVIVAELGSVGTR